MENVPALVGIKQSVSVRSTRGCDQVASGRGFSGGVHFPAPVISRIRVAYHAADLCNNVSQWAPCGVGWGGGFPSPTGRPRLPWLNVDSDAARSPFYDGYCVISVPPQSLVVTSRLTNVLVRKLMSQTHPLRLVLDGLPIYDGMLELLDDGLVDSITLYESQ